MWESLKVGLQAGFSMHAQGREQGGEKAGLRGHSFVGSR
jgi:hypothetical protein